MRVLVTGGTGFVGGHVVAALVAAGHDVRMLVRRPEQVPTTLGPLGVEVGDVVSGDVLDRASVERALDGCDAVVHAAAVFSLDPRRTGEVLTTNERATELVLGGAVERGLDPVVHVSSTVALVRHGGTTPDLPLGDLDLPYARSKIASERVARRLQDAGAPVTCVYPGGVLGPHDPYLGTIAELMLWIASGRLPVFPSGRMHYVDVRDVAAVVAATMEPGRGPRRYVVPGWQLDGDALYGAVRRVTGRRRPHAEPPRAVLVAFARLFDRVNRVLPPHLHLPGDPESMELMARETAFDTSGTTADLGVSARPLDDSVRDTLLALAEQGRLRRRHLGRLRAG
ncbi:NAD-dependent epimerase/dehydratase family protein [Nocardioides pocheonensis]|uniref:NAD-dependent epimerase/dehydratase family protein n=1 Tax=Nocardioides pocheonensis TaxID=661485 RepID=A0A3N0GRD7_9ACTN|nr:NAD-dependent epimerase/dehydratase family protein [Nocardioides pocheonensis]RNM15054.1 NAD-dependent epimerase/dehydratase family protein [Nocardioides pocheonensis]